MKRTMSRGAGALASGLGLLALTAMAGPAAAAAPAGTRTTTLHVSVGAAGTTGLPARVHAGEYTFAVTESGGSDLQVGRLRGGYTAAHLNADVAAGFGAGDLAAIERIYHNVVFEGGTGGAPAEQFTTYLEPGRYFSIDTNGSAPVRPFTVTAAGRTAADPPAVDATIVGYEDAANPGHFGFRINGTVPRSGTLRFTSQGTDEPHFLAIAKLAPGKTADDCLMGAGDAACTEVFSTGIVSPGQSIAVPYTLPGAGRYVLACFLPEPDNGMEHAMLGMVRTITVA